MSAKYFVKGGLFVVILSISFLPARKAVSNIVFGAGYSTDTQQITQQRCYQATATYSNEESKLRLNAALSSSQLEDELKMSASAGGKYEMFAAEAKAEYLRSVQEKDYSVSLNYYHHVTNNAAVQIAGFGERALTDTGKTFYQNGKNPYFGLTCGDYYIASYRQGALLIMGLNMKFSSSEAKQEFMAEVGASFADIIKASTSIKAASAKLKTTGTVVIQAFQMGGEPNKLSQILHKDDSGNYNALSCRFEAMDDCVKTANGLLDYAAVNFPKQINFENGKGLTPLGIGFCDYYPIKRIGLTPPASLVTPTVVQYRNELSTKLKENEYYRQKLYPFFNNGYPGKLDDAFINSAKSVLSKADRNVRIIMQPHDGGVDCFSMPDDCQRIKESIDSKLQKITTDDLKFLEAIKYKISTPVGFLYNDGKRWFLKADDPKIPGRLIDVFISDEKCSYHVEIIEQMSFTCVYSGRAVNGTEYERLYVGDMVIFFKERHEQYFVKRLVTSFFFEAYDARVNVPPYL